MRKETIYMALFFICMIAGGCHQKAKREGVVGMDVVHRTELKRIAVHQMAIDSLPTAIDILDVLYGICPDDPQIPFLRGVAQAALQQDELAKADFRLSALKYDSLLKIRPSGSDAVNYAACLLLAEDSITFHHAVDSLSGLSVYKDSTRFELLHHWERDSIIPELIKGFKENYR